MCEPQLDDTLGDVLEQEYFPFMYDRRLKLTAQEKALKVIEPYSLDAFHRNIRKVYERAIRKNW